MFSVGTLPTDYRTSMGNYCPRDCRWTLARFKELHCMFATFLKLSRCSRWSHDPQFTRLLHSLCKTQYLNKTCYNGLYRVNRKGQFNVPMGRYKNPSIFDAEELRAASRALEGVTIEVADFRDVLKRARKNDFVYFDPPYYPLSKTAGFASYTEHPFGKFEHESLALVARALSEKGCKVMVNNSWTEFTRRLYFGFKRIELKATRSINSKAGKRGKISEMVVVNHLRGQSV
ncbi:MAG: Dam family site-specific DNA-(adenine-N6)-methyltransferase [Chloroflexi bacterium]|nr:Dam family site-specific DNA-(adenine-N6)-methyltransferase [Chloroflexota bacterium]